MKITYTLPIIKENSEEILKRIDTYEHEYSYFEIWLDYISDISTKSLDELIKRYPGKLIFLFRRQKLELPVTALEKRLTLLDYLANKNMLIDLDMETQKEEVEKVKELNIMNKLILSYHNYQNTPKETELKKILQEMKRHKAKIIKIATFCITVNDSMRLLQLLLQLKEEKQACIILGMGKNGLVTRVFGTLWGNEMIFAPIESQDESAPNQLTRNQLEHIFNGLGV